MVGAEDGFAAETNKLCCPGYATGRLPVVAHVDLSVDKPRLLTNHDSS